MTEFHTTTDVDLPPSEVWQLVVDDDERGAWFGGETTLEPVEGGGATFTEADGTRRSGRIEEAIPERRLSWTWWPDLSPDQASRVSIELVPIGPGTRISVTEVPLHPAAASAAARSLSTGMLSAATVGLELRAMLRATAPVPTATTR